MDDLTFTKISHTLGIFDGFTHNSTVGIGLTQFILSGIGSVTTSDILKISQWNLMSLLRNLQYSN